MRATNTVTTRKHGIVDDPSPTAAARELTAVPRGQEGSSFSGDPNFMASLARGLAVVRAFAQQPNNQTIAQLSHKTGIPRAAVRRCLYTLSQLGYVTAGERHFSLAPKILALGHAYLSSTPLVASALPFLDQVNATVNESCSVAVLDEGEIVYVARSSNTTRIMAIDLKPGSRLPAYCSSMGRVLLANLPRESLEDYMGKARFRPHTERTVTSKEKLLEILVQVREKGYAIIDQELEMGLRSIAVPIHDGHGRVVAAMNVGAHAVHMSTHELETRALPALRAAAQELGTLLYSS
jgi:IclR family transcriptional regulator, pca regulon regulatory protein